MVLGGYENYNHWYQGRDDETKINLDVSGHDEPPVSVAALQFSGAFGAGYTASRVFTPNPNLVQRGSVDVL